MAIPKAVAQQAAKAKELIEQQTSGNTGPQPAQPENTDPPADPAPAQAPAPQPASEEPEAPNTPAQPEPAQPAPPVSENWEQKYRVIQGKYNSETASMRQQIAQLTQQVSQLQAAPTQPAPSPAIDFMQGTAQPVHSVQPEVAPAAPQQAPAQPPQPAQPDPLFTKEEEDEFGQDLCQFIARKVDRVVEQRVRDAQDKLGQRIGQVESLTAGQQFERSLDTSAPNWRVLNSDQQFLAWLDQPDPTTSIQRRALLDGAYQQGNARIVANIFNAYDAVAAAAVEQPPQPAPAPAQAAASDVVPPRGPAAHPPSSQAGKPKYRLAQWRAAINDLAQSRATGRITAADYDAKYSELMAAFNDGRVQQ